MNKFQPFKFNNLEEFYNFLPEKELELVLFLQDLILDTIPNIKVKLSYNVPFFYKNKNICLIWPGSVPWGKVPKSGVELAFTKGYLLDDKHNYLVKGNRKQVYNKIFYSSSEIDLAIVQELLIQADELDSTYKKTKK